MATLTLYPLTLAPSLAYYKPCLMPCTSLGGRVVIRLACGGMEQTMGDVAAAWSVIQKEAMAILP